MSSTDRDAEYSRWLASLTVAEVEHRYRALGVSSLRIKRLADAQDNSKNQILLGGDISKLDLPVGAFTASPTASRKPSKKQDKFHAPMDLRWLTPAGSNPAPHAQVIFYPQYPETRLSGFLLGAVEAPRRLLERDHVAAHHIRDRILVLGAAGTQVYGLVLPPQAPAAIGLLDSLGGVVFGVRPLEAGAVNATMPELLGELHGVHLMSPIVGCTVKSGLVVPNAAPNAGGTTLETVFGVAPNAIAGPDFRGWELKSHSGSKITLMTPAPTGGYAKEHGLEAFMPRFGYWDDAKQRWNFTGAHTATKAPGGKATTKMEVDAKEVILLHKETDEVAMSWSMEVLLDKWRVKHAFAAYVPRTGNAIPGFTYGPTVTLGEGASFNRYRNAIESGAIVFDPAIWWMPGAAAGQKNRHARHQIRVNESKLDSLYRSLSKHDVREYVASRELAEQELAGASLVLPDWVSGG